MIASLAEARAGQILREMPKAKAGRKTRKQSGAESGKVQNPQKNRSRPASDLQTLSELGIGKDESSRMQTAAAVLDPWWLSVLITP